jgi:hypothetical protein
VTFQRKDPENVVCVRAAEVIGVVIGRNVTSAATSSTPGPERITSYDAVVRSVVAVGIATGFMTSTRVLSQGFVWSFRRRKSAEPTYARNGVCEVLCPRKPIGRSILLPNSKIDLSAVVQHVETSLVQRLEGNILVFDVVTINHAFVR